MNIWFLERKLLHLLALNLSLPFETKVDQSKKYLIHQHFVTMDGPKNTVPIASTQVAIKGIVQYSTRAQLATRHSREHTLSAVGPDAQVE